MRDKQPPRPACSVWRAWKPPRAHLFLPPLLLAVTAEGGPRMPSQQQGSAGWGEVLHFLASVSKWCAQSECEELSLLPPVLFLF